MFLLLCQVNSRIYKSEFWGKVRHVCLDLGIISREVLFKAMGVDSVIEGKNIYQEKRKRETQQWCPAKMKDKQEYEKIKNLERAVRDIGRHQSYISQKPR